MAKIQPIQSSFSAGEVSPLVQGQTTSERYAQGLETCENFLPRAQGPLELRGGLRHIATIPNESGTQQARAMPLDLNAAQQFVTVVADATVSVYDRYGPLRDGLGGIQQIFNGDFDSSLLGWQRATTGTGIVTWSEVVQPLAILETLDATDTAVIGQSFSPLASGQHDVIVSILQPPGPTNAGTLTLKAGTALGDDSLLNQVLTVGTDQVFSFSTTPAQLTYVSIEASADVGTWWIDKVLMYLDLPSTAVSFSSPWLGYTLNQLDYEQHPTAAQLICVHPRVEPHTLTVDASNVWTLAPLSFTGKPAEWTGTNQPSRVTFGIGRMWLAATPAKPTTIWGSNTIDLFDFTVGTTDEDALEYQIAVRGTITWISGARELIIGTEQNEIILSGPDGYVTPTTALAVVQSSYGSFNGGHVSIGEKVVYISGGERKLRSMGYRFQEDAWVSTDLAWPSEDLTDGRVYGVVWQRDPQQVLWMHDRVATSLIACAYDREQGVVGWARCPTANIVFALAVTEYAGGSDLWSVVLADVGAGKELQLQRLDRYIYFDSSVDRAYSTPTTTVTDLDHLEGRTVGVTTDGAHHPDRVVAAGQIELQFPATFVRVGLRYTGRAVTLPLEGGVQRGTSQGIMKRWSKIYARINASVPPMLNGYRPPDRTPSTPMNTREPNVSEDYSVRDLGRTRKAQVEIVQDLPFPTTVMAIFGEVASEPM